MSDIICSVCAGTDSEVVIQAQNYPVYLLPVPPEVASEVVSGSLVISACRICGHMQQINIDESIQKSLYEDYYSHYSVDSSEALVPHYRIPFEVFYESLGANGDLPGGRILEIGCSSGERVALWRRYFGDYVGIDASTRIELARQRHPDVQFLQGFFPSVRPQGYFNGIVTQFNLEHIPDIAMFLNAAYELSCDDAVLIIQVPDAADWTRKGQPNFIAHEHIQYFRRPQLDLVLRRHGWKAFSWGNEGPSLICAARRTAPDSKARIAEIDPMAQPRAQAALFAARPPLPSGKLAFYGVGPLLFWLLEGLDAGRIAAVIDDNPRYHGLCLPGGGITVQASTPQAFSQADAIVLSLNPMYHPAVLKKLRSLSIGTNVCTLAEGQWNLVTA